MKQWLVLVLMLGVVGACSRREVGSAGTVAQAPVATAAPAAAAQAGVATPETPAEQKVYVDVRTPAEYAAGHVVGAINIPVEQLEQRWQELEPYRARPIALYCRGGVRAGTALGILQAHGFAHASNAGGLEGLKQQGVRVTP